MATKNIRCCVVGMRPESADRRPSSEPQAFDLLPWADPYIAQLIMSLEQSACDVEEDPSRCGQSLPGSSNRRLCGQDDAWNRHPSEVRTESYDYPRRKHSK